MNVPNIKNQVVLATLVVCVALSFSLSAVAASTQPNLAISFNPTPSTAELPQTKNTRIPLNQQQKDVDTPAQEKADRASSIDIESLNFLLDVLATLAGVLAALAGILTLFSVAGSLSIIILSNTIEKKVNDKIKPQISNLETKANSLDASLSKQIQELSDLTKKADTLDDKVNQADTSLQEKILIANNLFTRLIIRWIPVILPVPADEPVTPEVRKALIEITQIFNALDNQAADTPEPTFTAKDYAYLGIAFYFAEKYDDAIELYEKALSKDKKDYITWHHKSVALYDSKKDYSEVVEALEQVINLTKDYNQAVESEKKANLKLYYCKALNNKGVVLGKLHDPDEYKCYDEVIKADDTYAPAWYNKACWHALKVKEHSDKEQVDLAIQCLEKAIKLQRGKFVKQAKSDKDFDAVREDERFKKLIEVD